MWPYITFPPVTLCDTTFWTALYAIAAWVTVAVLGMAALGALRQVKAANDQRDTQIALEIIQRVVSFRNDPSIRVLRDQMGPLYGKVRMLPEEERAQRVLDWVAFKRGEVRYFLAQMNNLALLANLIPPRTQWFGLRRRSVKDDVLEVMWENLIMEWDTLKPFVEAERRKKAEILDQHSDWYMCHLEELSEYARAKRKELGRRLAKRRKRISDLMAQQVT